MSVRALRWLVAVAVVALATVSGWYYLMGTPQYSLSRFAAAIHGRDAAAAERFIDVDRVSQAAADVVASEYLGGNSAAGRAIEALGQGTARTVAGHALRPLVAARVRDEIRKTAAAGGSGAGGFVLPAGVVAAFRGLDVAREGPGAWVIYRDPRAGQTRFRMTQQVDRSWKITEFDREWVRSHLKDRTAG